MPNPKRNRDESHCPPPAKGKPKSKWVAIVFRLIFVSAWWLGILPAMAQPSLSGRVLNGETGFGMVGIDLDVFDGEGKPVDVTGAISGTGGEFSILLPAAGMYFLRADASRTDLFADVYYQDSFLKSEATPIEVGADTAITGIELRLMRGFEIRGEVRGGGVPLADIDLDVFAENGEFLGGYPATTLADGTFAIGALPSGTYFVRADPDPSLGQNRVKRFYGGSLEIEGAAPIQIIDGDVGNLVIDLDEIGGIISGTITRLDSGVPLEGIDLDVYDSSGQRRPFNAMTDATGHYWIGPFPPGDYFLRADPEATLGFERLYYPAANFLVDATSITVPDNGLVEGIDFALDSAGWLVGVIQDATTGQAIAEIDIDVYDITGRRLDLTAKSDSQGQFLVGPLPVGEVLFRADPMISQYFARVYYPAGGSMEEAEPVSIAAAMATETAPIELQPAGAVAGRILEAASGADLEAIDIDLFDTQGNRVDLTARSAADGSYALGPLLPGFYVLRADPTPEQGVVRSYFPGTPFFDAAQPIEVHAKATTGSIDLSLGAAGWVSGRITSEGTALPLADIDLDVFLADGRRLDVTAHSVIDGTYQLGPIPEGPVLLRADPGPMSGWLTQYFSGASNLVDATAVDVVAGQPSEGIDFVLPPAGWIAGSILSENLEPLAGIDLDLFWASDGARVRSGDLSNSDGSFAIGPLAPGEYTLRADPEISQGYAVEYFQDQLNKATATAILVTAAAGTSDITFHLSSGGSLSGRITAADTGTPIPDMDIDVLVAGSLLRLDQSRKTDAEGYFTLGPLAAGEYLVRADPTADQDFARTYYGQSYRSGDAATVSLPAGGQLSNIDIQVLRKSPPQITLDQPTSGSLYTLASPIRLSATAGDPDGAVARVEFYGNDVLVGSVIVPPYEWVWTPAETGSYTVHAVAVDNHDLSAVSDSVTVQVEPESAGESENLEITTSSDGSLTLSFPTIVGRTYHLESTANLTNPAWTIVESKAGTGEALDWHLSGSGEPHRFYRIHEE